MATNYFSGNKDIQFHMKKAINWGKIVPLHEEITEKYPIKRALEDYTILLKELGKMLPEELGQHAKANDEVGVVKKEETGEIILPDSFYKTLARYEEMGAFAVNVKKEYGGGGMPGIINAINIEMACKADASFMTVYAFYSGVAKTLEAFASEELKKKYIPKLASGEYGGSMALTEPNAGSDLGNIQVKAEKTGFVRDQWEISGNKIFISNGHGEISLVLARSDDKDYGTEGLSLYIVPRFIQKDDKKVENFKLGKLEHKLGIKGSPTLELLFDKSIGYLVGEEGAGLKEMFHLMNEARLGVSMQALGIAQRAFEEAKEYASQRVQFKKPIGEHELLMDKLLDMETDLKAMRSFVYKACEYDDTKMGLEEKLKTFKGSKEERAKLEKEYKKYKFLAREFIPLVKYFSTEKCIKLTRDNIQVHGGNGFTTEYPAELHLRDSIITAIYEGTSEIQSLMAMKDTLDRSRVMPYLDAFYRVGRLFKTAHKTNDMDLSVLEAREAFNNVVDHMRRPFAKLKAKKFLKSKLKMKKSKKDEQLKADAESYVQYHAERLTRIKAYKTLMEISVDEAKKFPERKPIAERFIQNYLPEIRKEERKIFGKDFKDTVKYIREMQEKMKAKKEMDH